MQRHDKRLRQLRRERQHILAIAAAKDSELVLEPNNIDIQRAEQSRSAHVVPTNSLANRRQYFRPLRSRPIVANDDGADVTDCGNVEQRRPHVKRERADPTLPRRIRREDRSPHCTFAHNGRTDFSTYAHPCRRPEARRLRPSDSNEVARDG